MTTCLKTKWWGILHTHKFWLKSLSCRTTIWISLRENSTAKLKVCHLTQLKTRGETTRASPISTSHRSESLRKPYNKKRPSKSLRISNLLMILIILLKVKSSVSLWAKPKRFRHWKICVTAIWFTYWTSLSFKGLKMQKLSKIRGKKSHGRKQEING